MSRLRDLVRFYALLDRLKEHLGGTRTLASFTELRDWPERGVYFFFDPNEERKRVASGLALSASALTLLEPDRVQHYASA